MLKISAETKMDAVRRYYTHGETYQSIADSIGVDRATIRDWCRLYESEGMDSFVRTKNNHYSIEFKAEVVEYYLSGRESHRDICKRFGIRSTYTLRTWIALYNSHELKASPGGGMIMTKGRTTTFEERIEIVSECLKAGRNYEKTAEQYQVSYQQVYKWVRKYKENGIDGLIDRRGRTKPVSEMSELEKIKAENKILKAQLERKELENIFLKKVEEIERRRS